jgi:hypothetical protein
MRRAVVGAVVGLLASVGAAAGAAGAVSRATGRDRVEARADASRLLAAASLPPGARRVASDPSAGLTLGSFAPDEATNSRNVADHHRYWRVTDEPQGVEAWLKAHVPSGAHIQYSGSDYAGWYVQFGFRSKPGHVVQRTLVVNVARAKGGGSAVRADGLAVWLIARPRWDQVPRSARLVTIRRAHRRTETQRVTVSNVSEVRQLAQLANRARVIQPLVKVGPCISYSKPLELVFRARPQGRVLASAEVIPTGCSGYLELRVKGRSGPFLYPGKLGRVLTRLWRRHTPS